MARLLLACPGEAWPELVGNALIVSDRLVREGVFTSTLHLTGAVRCEGTKLGKEEISRDIPGVPLAVLRHLDPRGIARPGAVVNCGELLLGKVSPVSKSSLTPEEKALHAIFGRSGEDVRNASLVYRHRDPGVVTAVRFRAWSRSVCPNCGDVENSWQRCSYCGAALPPGVRDDLPHDCFALAEVEWDIVRKLREGDVLADSRGGHHTVARIVPQALMPKVGDRSADVLTRRRSRRGEIELKKLTVYLEQKALVRGVGAYDERTEQPTTEELDDPAQVVEAATAVALLRAGLTINLAEMLGLKSDDVDGRAAVQEGHVAPTLPAAARRLAAILKASGFTFPLGLASADEIAAWSQGEVCHPETLNPRTCRPERGGCLCERIFGPEQDWECGCGKYRGDEYRDRVCDRCGVVVTWSRVRRERLGHITLARPVFHPWFLNRSAGLADLLGLAQSDLKALSRGELDVVVRAGQSRFREEQLLPPGDGVTSDEQFAATTGAAALAFLLSRRGRPDLTPLALTVVPVYPAGLRPSGMTANDKIVDPHLSRHYARLVRVNNRLRTLVEQQAPELVLRDQTRELQNVVNTLFGSPINGEDCEPLRNLAHELWSSTIDLLRKSVDYSARAVVVPDAAIPPGSLGLPRFIAEALLVAVSTRPLLAITDDNRLLTLEPLVVEGEALRLNPADGATLALAYAGDRLTLHLPLTEAAVAELRNPQPTHAAEARLHALTAAELVALVMRRQPLELTPLDRLALGLDNVLQGQRLVPRAERHPGPARLAGPTS